jgi:tyrosine-protein phosphatase YwqE
MSDIVCLDELSDMGTLFQINAGSPAGWFGEEAMNISCKMLEAGYVDFVGSDAHSIVSRNTDMLSAFDDYPYTVTQEDIKRIAISNPEFIINDTKYTPLRKKYIKEI